MNKDWTYKKLGEVTTKICDGSHNPPHGVEYSKYPMLSSKNIFFDRYDYESPRYLSKEDFEIEDKRTNVSDGDVLLTIVGTVGRTCCVMAPYTPFTLQRSVAVLKPKKEMMLSRFLMYSLHSLSALWETEAKGVAQKGVYLKQVANIQIPIPSLDEQQQIVAELDLLSDVIEKQKAQIEELNKLAQSIFYDMFGDPVTNEKGWEVKKIGEIGNVERGAGISKKDFVEEGLPCIHYGQLHTCLGATTHEHKTCIPKDLLPKYKIAHPGDVIMAITSEDVEGSCTSTAWLGDYDIVVGSDAAIFHHSINGVYISYYTRTKAFYNEKAKYAKGFKVTHISTSEIETIPIPLPPLSLQQEFAAKIEAIEAMKAKVRQSLKESETLFNSRMDYYFN